MYKTKITEVGTLAPSFEEEKIIILFGPEAPQEIREIALIHDVSEDSLEEPVKVGGVLQIDDQEFTITAVGSAANQNLKELGHISIYFTEPAEEVLPGAVFASPSEFPKFKDGSIIIFK
ncbi:PTS glucitol/sorbitol transporter subunit IIA [Paucisalibacillus sp. EB02]|uniref:PTS glucitol/sorbitol transporter subunit IIA n=1 Tax=Paucisalibacillus sp. EB02 TaxID=1347087 RepID=UPI0004B473C1|nr:PTS glucitol/sorbitol transporter subunit IIA [Paucisalibacillus sp. EB02]